VPSELRIPFKEELTAEALLLVEHRSRLDRELWRAVAARRIAGADLTALREIPSAGQSHGTRRLCVLTRPVVTP
jgi:hypothetical protein